MQRQSLHWKGFKKKKKMINTEEILMGLQWNQKLDIGQLRAQICRAAKLPHFISNGEPPTDYACRLLSIEERAAGARCWNADWDNLWDERYYVKNHKNQNYSILLKM